MQFVMPETPLETKVLCPYVNEGRTHMDWLIHEGVGIVLDMINLVSVSKYITTSLMKVFMECYIQTPAQKIKCIIWFTRDQQFQTFTWIQTFLSAQWKKKLLISLD